MSPSYCSIPNSKSLSLMMIDRDEWKLSSSGRRLEKLPMIKRSYPSPWYDGHLIGLSRIMFSWKTAVLNDYEFSCKRIIWFNEDQTSLQWSSSEKGSKKVSKKVSKLISCSSQIIIKKTSENDTFDWCFLMMMSRMFRSDSFLLRWVRFLHDQSFYLLSLHFIRDWLTVGLKSISKN